MDGWVKGAFEGGESCRSLACFSCLTVLGALMNSISTKAHCPTIPDSLSAFWEALSYSRRLQVSTKRPSPAFLRVLSAERRINSFAAWQEQPPRNSFEATLNPHLLTSSAMNPTISLPRQHGSSSNFGGTLPSNRNEGVRMPRFFKRLFKFPQMDFEMAVWEMTSLIIAPKKVFRSIIYHVSTGSE